ncbi:hypothetical protein GCM10010269_57270 [Streptomyces humidus]|uniref:Uncharacterized protein n=1 Tax=Streptomyces humidus TaxID=52259 RepID=A0A918L5V8_9ACTN|nr:hypothetical protein GCM10010269_57270 [Streptomyces humidus]
MACFAPTAPRTRGCGSATVWPVLLAVLAVLGVLALLPGSSASGGEHSRAARAAVAAAEAASSHSASYADRADPAVSTVSVRGHRAGAGERHAPPGSAPGASLAPAATTLRLALFPPSARGFPTSEQPAHLHGVRAPPAPSGI